MSALPRLSPQVCTILCALIEEKLGLHFGPEYRDQLEEKLGPRAAERGFESMLDYYYFLRYDEESAEELNAVADALTINETYFFREAVQLGVLVDEIVAPLVARGTRPRIWCAASSTGEEPLTVAALLDDRGLLERTEIVATDISARALDVARLGRYGARSVRTLESIPEWLRLDGDRYVVSGRLRNAVEWRRLNLLDDEAVRALGVFDAILCRNVLIYFRDDTINGILRRLHGALAPAGYVLVGAAESLLRLGTTFHCEERRGAFLYRKAAS